MALVFYQVTGAKSAAVPGLSQTFTPSCLDGALGHLAEPLMPGSCGLIGNQILICHIMLLECSQLVIVIGFTRRPVDGFGS